MKKPPKFEREEDRLAALHCLEVLDTPEEERFDRLTRLAAAYFDVPICLVSLVDRTRQWFKSRCGLASEATSRDISFCGHAINQQDVLVIEDAHLDPRFADNPLVIDEPHIRSYAGAQLRSPEGLPYGTLCLIDRRPRKYTAQELEDLREFAHMVQRELGVMALHRRYAALAAGDPLPPALEQVVPIGIFKTDREGSCTYTNPRWREITGLTADQAAGTGWGTAIHPDDRDRVLSEWNEITGSGELGTLEFRFRRPSGETRWVLARAAPSRDAEGEITGWVGTSEDITERRFMEQALRDSEQRFRQLVNAIEDVFWVLEVPNFRFAYVSPGFERLWGIDPTSSDDPGLWLESVHEEDRERVRRDHLVAIQAGRAFELTYRICRDGAVRWIRSRGFPIEGPDGTVVRYAGLSQDITRQRELELELERLASTDRLTGMLNVVAFRTRVHQEIARAERTGAPLSLAMIDLDEFKSINDGHGHQTGDRAIVAVAELLRGRLRTSDVIGRYGGDEFCALLPDTDTSAATAVMGKVVRAVRELDLRSREGERIRLTVSIGVAQHRPSSDEDALFNQADGALYQVKHSGRDGLAAARAEDSE